ncbi:MAG: insulinase family protein, partial [Spirochaetaceae bacterium]|nr:insulinase family protein [Spirochaetaceae bacterium]
ATINPVFNEKSLIENLREYKSEIKMTRESPEGFLNSAVETVLFPHEPWKQFSLVNPHLIEDVSSGEARKILFSLRNEFYIPHRSALFVCGNVDVEKIYEIVRQKFEKWENPDYIPLTPKKNGDNLSKPGHFILKSEIFSKDFTQIAAYFPLKDNQSHIEGDMVAAILEKRTSAFKNAIMKNPILGIENLDFVNVSYEARSDSPFLLVQILLGKKFDFAIQQRELLRIFTNLSGFLPDEEIVAAKSEKIRAWKGEVSSNFSAISSFADNTATTGCSPEEFWGYESRILRIQSDDLRSVPQRRPYVFYMLNPEDENSSITAQRIIDETTKFWFDDDDFLVKREVAKKVPTTPVVQDYMVLANSFYDHSVAKISRYTTKSGVKITMNKNVTNENSAICINFLGGDLVSDSVSNAFLSEFAVAAFSRQISVDKGLPAYAQISDEPSFEANRVIIKVRPGNIKKVLQSVATALNTVPLPQIFDEALYRVRRRARQQRASNEYRMYSEAYRTILGEKPASHSFAVGDGILEGISLKVARESYLALADSSRIQISVSGNENFQEITDLCDTLFAFLQGKNLFASKLEKSKAANSPVLPTKVTSVKIDRIFDADIKNKAAKGIPLLVPSKKQQKNVFVFFPIPDYNEENFASVGFILEEFKERITGLLVKNNKLADEVKLFFAPNHSSLGYFTFMGVENFDELKKAFDRAL